MFACSHHACDMLTQICQCASVPFALVSDEWEHEDQTIPASKRSMIVTRDGSAPSVRGVRLVSDLSSGKNDSQYVH